MGEVGRRCAVGVRDGRDTGAWVRGRVGVVRDVGQERRVHVQHVRWHGNRTRARWCIGGAAALDETGCRHVLRQPSSGSGDELPVRVSCDHRDVRHVPVEEPEPEQARRLVLDRSPGGHTRAPVRGVEVCQASSQTAEELARRDGVSGGVVLVLPKEHLVGGVRGVRLALVDPGRVRVVGVLDVVGGAQDAVRTGLVLRPGQHHEPQVRAQVVGVAEDVVRPRDQRVVGVERHEDRATALDGLVDPVVEELAEEGEEGVVRRREADVRRDVGDVQGLERRHAARGNLDDRRGCSRRWVRRAREQARVALGPDRDPGCSHGGRVRRGLVDDQVADDPRLRVDDRALLLRVAGRPGSTHREARRDRLGVLENWCGETREGRVRRAEVLPTGDQVVARAVDGPQTVGGQGIRDLIGSRPDERPAGVRGRERIGVVLADLDLLEDERQVGRGDDKALAHGSRGGTGHDGGQARATGRSRAVAAAISRVGRTRAARGNCPERGARRPPYAPDACWSPGSANFPSRNLIRTPAFMTIRNVPTMRRRPCENLAGV